MFTFMCICCSFSFILCELGYIRYVFFVQINNKRKDLFKYIDAFHVEGVWYRFNTSEKFNFDLKNTYNVPSSFCLDTLFISSEIF